MASNRPKVLLIKEEVTPGTDPTPTAADNAILIRDDVGPPQLNIQYAGRNNAKGFFGRNQQIPVGASLSIGFQVEAAGSGTPGTLPKWAACPRTSGMSVKTLAAAVADTAQAGAASTITLHAGGSAVNDFYRGYRIRTTGGTGSGQTRSIKSYVGATKIATVADPWTVQPDATTTFSIDAQNVWHPSAPDDLKTATIYFYHAGLIHKLLHAHGTPRISFPRQDLPLLGFDYTGIYGGIVDGAMVAATLSGFQTPVGVNNANTGNFVLHGVAGLKMYSLEMMLANAIAYRNVVGVEDTILTDRAPSGSVEIETPLLATLDWVAKVRTGALGTVALTHGTVAGNKIFVDSWNAGLTNPADSEQEGQATKTFDLELNPTDAGNDEFWLGAA